MTQCLIIGKTNAGKTLFAVNFSEFLGAKSLRLSIEYPDGATSAREYSFEEARKALVGPEPHQTRCLHSTTLTLPMGKGSKEFQIVDTSGLIDEIHPDVSVRQAMAQTLASVRNANIILHVIDAFAAKEKGTISAFGEVDYQVAQFAQMRGGYAILANKMDLPGAAEGLSMISREFSGHRIIPISALTGRGFREVKQFVWRNL